LFRKSILRIYNFIFPKDSITRARLYSRFLWKYFPDPVDKFLIEFSEKNKSIKFIQVGANDGISFDPVYKFVKKYNWSGVLIEPLQPYFDELKRNYFKIKNHNLYFEKCAISKYFGNETIYFISNLTGKEKDYEVLKAISSFNRNHVLRYIGGRKTLEIKSAEITVTTLEDIIEKYHYHDFNILIIDTEGFDFEIIKTINFKEIKPDIILYEHIHLSEDERKTCMKLLKLNGYKSFEDGINTLAYM